MIEVVLVIGSTSFIGVYVVDALIKNNFKVAVAGRNNRLDSYYRHKNVDVFFYDLLKPDTINNLPKDDIEAVIVTAAILPANESANIHIEENVDKYIKGNLISSFHLLEYCRNNNVNKLINLISYADMQNYFDSIKPIKDDMPRSYKLQGDHAVYIITKTALSDLMEYYNNEHGMKNVIFRLPPVYGVGPHGSLFDNGKRRKSGLMTFIDNAKEGKDIYVYGNKDISRDVVYVKDVADALVKAIIFYNSKGVYNITSGVATSMWDMALACAKVFNGEKKSRIINDTSIVNNAHSYLFDISKARHDFGYNPKFANFEEMMNDWKNEENRNVYPKLFQK